MPSLGHFTFDSLLAQLGTLSDTLDFIPNAGACRFDAHESCHVYEDKQVMCSVVTAPPKAFTPFLLQLLGYSCSHSGRCCCMRSGPGDICEWNERVGFLALQGGPEVVCRARHDSAQLAFCFRGHSTHVDAYDCARRRRAKIQSAYTMRS